MRKTAGFIFLGFTLLAAARPAPAEAQSPAEKAFQEIKILIFDEKWTEAEARLNDLLSRSPEGSLAAQALFYKARCVEEIGGREREALRTFQQYLGLKDRNRNLAQDAEVSIIDLALKLYEKGDKGFLGEVENRLGHPDKVVRYYAAVQLSNVKDKKIAEKAVPVLKTIVAGESNAELRDRAKIALLRVSPDALSQLEDQHAPRRARILHIEIVDEITGKLDAAINIPWALADLALAAIGEEDLESIKAKGYDIPTIIRKLETSGGDLIEVSAEGKRFKIWIR